MSRAARSVRIDSGALAWDPSTIRARCDEPEGDPTEEIPAPLLRRLLAESTGGVPMESATMRASVPRFEIVELGADEVTDLDEDVVFDDDDDLDRELDAAYLRMVNQG
jgi:hypothetical protein